MKKILLLALITINFLYSNKINTINLDWVGLYPSFNSNYKFESTNFKYNTISIGIGIRKANYCTECSEGEYLRTDKYYVLPSISIFNEINNQKQKNESGFLFILGSDTFTISHFKIDKYYMENDKYFYKIGLGYGMMFSATSHNIPFILPTIGFGIDFK